MKWRTIEEFPDYQVSDTGRVRSKVRVIEQLSAKGNPYYRTVPAKEMSPFNNGLGYLQVNLRNKKRFAKPYVHVLVAMALLKGGPHGKK